MAERKKFAVGETVEVTEGRLVVRPDGAEVEVTGGTYVLDVPGEFVIDGKTVEAK